MENPYGDESQKPKEINITSPLVVPDKPTKPFTIDPAIRRIKKNPSKTESSSRLKPLS